MVGGVRNTISTVDLRASQARLTIEENKRKDVNLKRDIAVDSLRTYQRQILELDNNVEVAGELGPLKYLSGLTGYPMDKIINLLLLVIIFVFDPLAVSLVIAANFAYNKAYPKRKFKDNLYGEKIEVKEEKSLFPEDYDEEDERRMNIIGQNGNDGEHYEESFDFNKDGKIDVEDIRGIVQQRDQHPPNSDAWNRLNQEVNRFKKKFDILDDDLTITY